MESRLTGQICSATKRAYKFRPFLFQYTFILTTSSWARITFGTAGTSLATQHSRLNSTTSNAASTISSVKLRPTPETGGCKPLCIGWHSLDLRSRLTVHFRLELARGSFSLDMVLSIETRNQWNKFEVHLHFWVKETSAGAPAQRQKDCLEDISLGAIFDRRSSWCKQIQNALVKIIGAYIKLRPFLNYWRVSDYTKLCAFKDLVRNQLTNALMLYLPSTNWTILRAYYFGCTSNSWFVGDREIPRASFNISLMAETAPNMVSNLQSTVVNHTSSYISSLVRFQPKPNNHHLSACQVMNTLRFVSSQLFWK